MGLSGYGSFFQRVITDVETIGDALEERLQAEQAYWLASSALPVVTDAALDTAYRLGYAASAAERIERFAPAIARRTRAA